MYPIYRTDPNKTLVLIGNGLDLYTGLKSSFNSFLSQLSPQGQELYYHLSGIKMDQFNKSKNWSNIEHYITKFVNNSFNPAHPGVSENMFQEIGFNSTSYLQQELISYLNRQQDNKNNPLKYSSNVSKFLNSTNCVINFNYTNTIQKIYKIKPSKIYFIHGSINENHIILGMDNDFYVENLPSSFGKLSKRYLRDILDFERYISNQQLLNKKELVNKFSKLDQQFYTWRKTMPEIVNNDTFKYFDDIDNRFVSDNQFFSNHTYRNYLSEVSVSINKIKTKLKKSVNKPIIDYLSKNGFRPVKIKLPMSIEPLDIKELTIIGHSLNSDRDIIESLITGAMGLKRINLFTYDGESTEIIKEQINYLKSIVPYKTEIVTKKY